ncbi:MAG: hypothetical protein ACTHJ3_11220 [Pararhizobium sp.]
MMFWTKKRREPRPPSVAKLAQKPALNLICLLLILAANVAGAYVDLGGFQFSGNIFLGLVSVALIGLFFMDLSQENTVNRLAASTGFVWLLLFFMITFGDYLTRTIHPF